MSRGVIQIYGVIGTEEGQISHQNIVDQVEMLGDVTELEIRINSKGGDVWEALGIYSTLNQHPARKIVFIDGIALSCASWIACVGDEINIASNGMYMYHEGRASPGHSTAEELTKHAATLVQLNGQMAETYAARTGIPLADIQAGMKVTTWLRAKDAVAMKFATKLIPNKAVVALCDVAVLNNAPDWVRDELTATVEELVMPEETTVVKTANATETITEVASLSTGTTTPNVVVNVSQPSATPIAPVAPEKVDIAGIENAVKTKERARIKDIFAICNLAGAPELASEYIANDTEVVDVQSAMYARVCADRKPVGPNAANVTNSGEGSATSSQDVADVANYEANKELITSMGVTKDAYLQQLKNARKK